MRFHVRLPLFLLIPLTACADPAQREIAAFCDPALARVDSFMATFHDEKDPGEKDGGTVVVAAVGDLRGGMNAFDGSEAAAAQHQQFVNLMTLIQYDEHLHPVPYLAESWEVSEDQTELTFHLRDDVLWHDGVRTTAGDVEFTFLRASDPAANFPNSAFFQYYLPGPQGVEVVDSLTVKFHLARPHMDFMDPWRAVAIMPRHLLESVPPGELAQHPFGTICPVGNGPFRFLSHDPGAQWVFEANPAFPEGLGGRPFLDRYVFRVIEEAPTLLAELQTGSIDVYLALLPHYADAVREDPNLDLVAYPNRIVFFAGWNNRIEKLSDPRVRTALTVATDRRRIVDGMREGMATVVNTGVPTTHWAYDPALSDSFPHDPDRARALLDAAGWEDRDGDGVRENEAGFPLSIELLYNPNQERQEVAEIMQAQLREVGVHLEPRGVELNALLSAIFSPDRPFEGFLMSWAAEFRLDERDLFHSQSVDGQYGFAGTRDPVMDRYMDTLQLVTDQEEAKVMWREYQLRQMQVHPFTFLYAPYRQNGVNRRLRGVVMDVRGDWQNIREWWIASDRPPVP